MIVYLITNKINNKKYVGLTTRSLGERWKEHIRKSRCEKLSINSLHYDIKKYNKDNFEIKKLIECSNTEELCKYERKFIFELDTIKEGYNRNTGGKYYNVSDKMREEMSENAKNKKKVYVLNKSDKSIKIYESVNKACRLLLLNKKCVFRVLSGKRKSHKGYIFSYSEEFNIKEKEIYKFDLYGNLINIYKNINVCSIESKIDKIYIYRVLSGKRKSHKGYIFKYSNDIKYTKSRIYQKCILENKILNIFDNIKEASMKTNINYSSISKIINGKRKSINNFTFYRDK